MARGYRVDQVIRRQSISLLTVLVAPDPARRTRRRAQSGGCAILPHADQGAPGERYNPLRGVCGVDASDTRSKTHRRRYIIGTSRRHSMIVTMAGLARKSSTISFPMHGCVLMSRRILNNTLKSLGVL